MVYHYSCQQCQLKGLSNKEMKQHEAYSFHQSALFCTWGELGVGGRSMGCNYSANRLRVFMFSNAQQVLCSLFGCVFMVE